MTRAQLLVSRALWLRRERDRYHKWRFYKFHSKRPRVERRVLARKWWKLYSDAHAERIHRDTQLANLVVHRVSVRGVALVAEFEGGQSPDGRFHAYQDPVGIWTIGYGHTAGVGPHSHSLSKDEALRLLRFDLNHKYGPAVSALDLPINQNQFDALVSFVYNVGPGGIGPATGVGRALRDRNWASAADHLLDWDKAGGRTLPGLTRRRQAERALFLK